MRARLSKIQHLLCLQFPTWVAAYVCRSFRRKAGTEVRSIIVFRLDGLGDCVLTLTLLRHLRLCYPFAVITVVTRNMTKEIFANSLDVDELLLCESTPRQGNLKLMRAVWTAVFFFHRCLRNRYFDIALTPRWDIDISMATLLCALTRAPQTIGYEDATTPAKLASNRGFQRAFTTILPAGPLQHEVLRNVELARVVGCVQKIQPPQIVVTPIDKKAAIDWLPQKNGGPRIALGIPAGSPNRRWPVELYLEVLAALRIRGNITPIIFVDDQTKAIGCEILRRFPHGQIASDLSLTKISAILSECDVFIGSDSGLGHVAAAVNCPTVTVSPHPQNADPNHTNSPIRFRPYGLSAIVIQPHRGRFGCERGCEANAPHCILDIDPNQVVLAVVRLRPFLFAN